MRLMLGPIFRHPQFVPCFAVLIAAIGMLPTLRFVWWRLNDVRGWEADAIAKAIVAGHGFSFPGTSQWLWEMWKGDPNTFTPTAWVDPVYVYILAGAHYLFGPYAYYAMYALTFACIAVILLTAYRIAERFGGPWTGVIAVAFIACNASLGRSYVDDMTNSSLAATALILLGLVAVRYFEKSSWRRLVAMGLMTGFTILTCPAAEYFAYLLCVSLVIFHIGEGRQAMLRPLTAVLLATLVIAPWTLRNYVTFGEFVLVRNGGGQIVWDSTVGTGATFIPGAAKSPLPPPWQSTGAHDAVQKMLDKYIRIPIHHYQVESVMAAPPPGYDTMNEAQRDKFYMSRTKEFVRSYPKETLEMAISKLGVYVTRLGTLGLLTIVLGVIGVISVFRDARSWPLALLAVSYSAPFIMIIAYYGRYRAPIEPVLAVLAAIGVTSIARWLAPTGFAKLTSLTHGK